MISKFLTVFFITGTTLLSNSHSAFSDGTNDGDSHFADFRKSFDSSLEYYEEQFDLAAKLVEPDTKLTQEITADECQAILARVQKNYRLSPWFQRFNNGYSYSMGCDLPVGVHPQIYSQNITFETPFGLTATSAVRVQFPNGGETSIVTHYFDAQDRYVEVTYFNAGAHQVAALDAKGNSYFTIYSDKAETPNAQFFDSADGMIPASFRMTAHVSGPTKKPGKIRQLYRANRADWDDFDLLLTFSWQPGFYTYKSLSPLLFLLPSLYDMLSTKTDADGNEICAYGESGDGFSKLEHLVTLLPDVATATNCRK